MGNEIGELMGNLQAGVIGAQGVGRLAGSGVKIVNRVTAPGRGLDEMRNLPFHKRAETVAGVVALQVQLIGRQRRAGFKARLGVLDDPVPAAHKKILGAPVQILVKIVVREISVMAVTGGKNPAIGTPFDAEADRVVEPGNKALPADRGDGADLLGVAELVKKNQTSVLKLDPEGQIGSRGNVDPIILRRFEVFGIAQPGVQAQLRLGCGGPEKAELQSAVQLEILLGMALGLVNVVIRRGPGGSAQLQLDRAPMRLIGFQGHRGIGLRLECAIEGEGLMQGLLGAGARSEPGQEKDEG